jgi:hypothetical protein
MSRLKCPREYCMQAQEFLASVRDQTLTLLPDSMRGAHARVHYGMLQLHYGEPRAHYEVWLVRKTGRIEIGLHFEAERELSHAWAEALAERSLELRDTLGPEADLEEWTASWMRLHLTLPLEALDVALCREVSGRLADLIRTTAEYVAAIVPRGRTRGQAVTGGRREHWRRRRKRAGVTGT